MKFFTAAVAFLLLLGNAHAYNITVDFQDVPVDGDTVSGPEPIISRGFVFSGLLQKGITEWPLGPVDDSRALHWFACEAFACDSDAITMTELGNSPFDLVSLELAHEDLSVDMRFELTGFIAGGGTVSTVLTSTSQTLTQFGLGAGWTNLDTLIIDPLDFNIAVAVDNIVLANTVPIPATVWLFGSALAGLGWLRRRQTA
jgi:hypothetical protein